MSRSIAEARPARVVVHSHDSGDAAWEMALASPHPALAGIVRRYCGYRERSVNPVRRRAVASAGVHLIVSFGDPIDIAMADGWARHISFAVGVSDTFGDTEFRGRQHGIQVDLTPLGAFRLLGLPMSELTNRLVDLDAVLGPRLPALLDRLACASDWPCRFSLLDEALVRRVVDGPDVDPTVGWAWRRLERTHGLIPVGALAAEIGWSRRHLVSRFTAQVGLSPKPAARVLRFQHAHRLLVTGSVPSIADLAAECGYADHSHLVREFNRLAGGPPSAFLPSALGPDQPLPM